MSEYTFETKLNKNKVVHFRKWKLKDIKAFKKIIKEENSEELLLEVLVKNVIEEEYALSPDELQYLITKIREVSVSDKVKFNWVCNCSSENSEEFDINLINKPKLSDFKTIDINGIEFKFGEILNKKIYEDTIKSADEDEIEIIDLCFHIHQIADNIDFTLSDILEYVEDMDISSASLLIEKYNEMKFRTDKVIEFTCKSCNETKKYEFDTIPDFFPESWFR